VPARVPEGGPTLAGAFLRDGLVDEVVAYLAPKLLGSGRNAVEAGLGTSITDALDLHVEDITVLGDNVRITGKPSNAVRRGTVQRRGF
jgi:diaminohydroxyphosphoribosylaminopyrimidine deaminase/5-amino-6-(5-phosphoribosylamino)uracil reductase